jgi:hypothetical protein
MDPLLVGVRPFSSTTPLRKAAFTSVPPMPSRMSRRNIPVIGSSPPSSEPGPRDWSWRGSSSNV